MKDKLVKKINRCIRGVKNGEKASLEELFALTKEHMRRVAYYYLYDKSLVNDVLSEAYIKIVKYSESFNSGKNGYNWLYQIVKNEAFLMNKYNANYKTTDLEKADRQAEDYTETLIDIISLRQALKTLDEDERALIDDIYWKDKSIVQIAKEKNIAYMTLHDKITRIIKKLEKFLD